MKAILLKSLFLFTRRLLNWQKTLTRRLPYAVSKLPLNFCMRILLIFDFKICSSSKILSSGCRPVHVKNVHLPSEEQDIELLQEQTHSKKQWMRLQTDLEFQQNEIKRLNEKYNVEMFSSWVRRGKAYAAEQKIRELKKLI